MMMMHDLICDVINYWVWRCNLYKTSLRGKIVIENLKKTTNGNKIHFYTEFHPKNGLEMEVTAYDGAMTKALRSADILYVIWIWRISQFCASCTI